ncbi:MAG: hypothetical protein UH850_08490, partial [Paludibacteraceae bacterium]|nr:hypothetical protein [Paludibacteraceae bacterium]
MIYLFLYNFYFSLWTNIVSFIKRKQVYPNETKNNAAVTSSIIVALHTLVNLLCLDGFLYAFAGFSVFKKMLSIGHEFLTLIILCAILGLLGVRVETYLEQHNYKFPSWWKNIYDRIPSLMKLFLYFLIIIGPVYILS